MSRKGNDAVTRTLKAAIDLINARLPEIEAALEYEAPDTKRPDDLQYLQWYAITTGALPTPPGFVGPGPNGEVYPEEVWISPEGLPVVGSAYILALPHWHGGKEELARYGRIIERTTGVKV